MSKVKINENVFKSIRGELGLTQKDIAIACNIGIKTVHNIENGLSVTNTTFSKIKEFLVSADILEELQKTGLLWEPSMQDLYDYISDNLEQKGDTEKHISIQSPFTILDIQASVITKVSQAEYDPGIYDPYLINEDKDKRFSNIHEEDYINMRKQAEDTSLSPSNLKKLQDACLEKNVIWKHSAYFGSDSEELNTLRKLSKIIESAKLNIDKEATSLNSLTESIEKENAFFECYSELQSQGLNIFLGWQVLNSGPVPIIFIVDKDIKKLEYSVKELHPRLHLLPTDMPFYSLREYPGKTFELQSKIFNGITKDFERVKKEGITTFITDAENLWIEACQNIIEEDLGGHKDFMLMANEMGYLG